MRSLSVVVVSVVISVVPSAVLGYPATTKLGKYLRYLTHGFLAGTRRGLTYSRSGQARTSQGEHSFYMLRVAWFRTHRHHFVSQRFIAVRIMMERGKPLSHDECPDKYLSGIRLWVVLAVITLASFVMFLDLTIISTVRSPFASSKSCYLTISHISRPSRTSRMSSSHYLISVGMEARTLSPGTAFHNHALCKILPSLTHMRTKSSALQPASGKLYSHFNLRVCRFLPSLPRGTVFPLVSKSKAVDVSILCCRARGRLSGLWSCQILHYLHRWQGCCRTRGLWHAKWCFDHNCSICATESTIDTDRNRHRRYVSCQPSLSARWFHASLRSY